MAVGFPRPVWAGYGILIIMFLIVMQWGWLIWMKMLQACWSGHLVHYQARQTFGKRLDMLCSKAIERSQMSWTESQQGRRRAIVPKKERWTTATLMFQRNTRCIRSIYSNIVFASLTIENVQSISYYVMDGIKADQLQFSFMRLLCLLSLGSTDALFNDRVDHQRHT